jgi:putative transposase
MKYDPKKHHRRSIRLKGYDYASPGAYFVTICVQGGECLLGEVVNGAMRLNRFGRVADGLWDAVPPHFARGDAQTIAVDAHVTMPNHVHAIITIHELPSSVPNSPPGDDGGATDSGTTGRDTQGGETPPLRSTVGRPALGQIVAYYKYQTTKLANEMRAMPGVRFWQRNYWEHVIRDERSYQRIVRYVAKNPVRWEQDQLHPDAPPNPFKKGRR